MVEEVIYFIEKASQLLLYYSIIQQRKYFFSFIYLPLFPRRGYGCVCPSGRGRIGRSGRETFDIVGGVGIGIGCFGSGGFGGPFRSR